MLITFSSRILARFHTGPPEILADGNFAFRPDLSKILTARGFVSRRESRQHSHRDIWLPAKNPGKTPAGILPRFWPPGIPPPLKNPGTIPAEIPPRFWPPGIPPPVKNPGKIPAEIPPRFWPPGIPPPAKNPGKIPAGIPPRFWPPGIPPPAKNPGKNPGGNRESRRPKSRRDPGGNLAGILARSRQDPGTIFTRAGPALILRCRIEFSPVLFSTLRVKSMKKEKKTVQLGCRSCCKLC